MQGAQIARKIPHVQLRPGTAKHILKKEKKKQKTEYKLFRLKKDPENDQNPVNLS